MKTIVPKRERIVKIPLPKVKPPSNKPVVYPLRI
jgi:hypothetical protein